MLPGLFRLTKHRRWAKNSVSNRTSYILHEKLNFPGNVSTHSIRKFSTETMQKWKVIRDASDQRGRWKTIRTDEKAQASNIYHNSFQRWLDLVAAAALCHKSCVRYEVEMLTGEMVLNLFPASKNLITGVGHILCCAALWAYKNAAQLLPLQLIQRIEAYGAQNLLVKRVRVVPDDDEFIDFDEDLHRATTQSDERQMLNKILIGQESLKRKQDTQTDFLQREVKRLKKTNKALCGRVDRVILYHTQSRSTSNTQNAQMYDCQSLHEYWLEYEFGINGHKSVKTFSTAEKRKYKDKICLRMKLIQNTLKCTPCNLKYVLRYKDTWILYTYIFFIWTYNIHRISEQVALLNL